MSQPNETPPPPSALSANINTIEQWLADNDKNANYNTVLETLQEFKRRREDLRPDDSSLEKKLDGDVGTFIRNNQIGDVAYDGGRRRKSASSSSRPRRRSSKKRGTQRKQKRRQRRGSRRA